MLNSPIFGQPELIEQLARQFGRQCLVASVDLARSATEGYEFRVAGGQKALPGNARKRLVELQHKPIGDLYLNSVDRDGTGQGYDLEVLDLLPKDFGVPVILAGGAGNANHFEAGLLDDRVDAVSTAHLLNFVGDGLHKARQILIARGIHLPVRDLDIRDLRASPQVP